MKVGSVTNSIFLRPRIFGRLSNPMSFGQTKEPSMSVRALKLMAYPAWRVVRALMAEPSRRSTVCAPCGVAFSSGVCRTNSCVS